MQANALLESTSRGAEGSVLINAVLVLDDGFVPLWKSFPHDRYGIFVGA